MLKQKARAIALGVLLADLALTALSLPVTWALRQGLLRTAFPNLFPLPLHPLDEYLLLLLFILPIWGLLLSAAGFYRSHRTLPLGEEIWAAGKVAFGGTTILVLLIFGLRLDFVSRWFLVLFGVLNFLFLTAEKIALRQLSRWVRSRGFNFRTALIVGTGPKAAQFADFLEAHPHWGFRVVGYLDDDNGGEIGLAGRWPCLGTIRNMEAVLGDGGDRRGDLRHREGQARGVRGRAARGRAARGARARLARHLSARAGAAGARGARRDSAALLHDDAVESGRARGQARDRSGPGARALRRHAAAPARSRRSRFCVVSGAPVFFRQVRCGLNGRHFTLLKFRTMESGAEDRLAEISHLNEMTGPVFKARRDPRLTAAGRLLRRLSIDELPQLWNVIVGDMSLVGPRPPLPDEVSRYEPWQRRRLSMKPGLTCLWQVSGRSELDFDRWMALDLKYIDTWSPLLDLKILLKTVPAVLSGRGAR